MDATRLAEQFAEATARGDLVAPPSEAGDGFELDAAYRVQAEYTRLRRSQGRVTTGVKVGYANRAVWRALKIATLVWAPMFDDTVHVADRNEASLSLGRMRAPKIEPEIVFRLKRPLNESDLSDAVGTLGAVEWMALGYEIVDCPYPDWKFQPVDFVAALGFHRALVVGEPTPIEGDRVAPVAEALPVFTARLSRGGAVVAEGGGKNILKSPALCLAELARAIARQPGAEPLAAGDLVTTGSLTDPQFIHAGEAWTATVDGIDLPPLTLHVRA
jgi:2-keto-4-pentenoate hydratase